MSISPSTILAGVGFVGLAAAAVTDLRSRKIPNAAVALVLGAGLLSRFAADGLAAWHSLVIVAVVSVPLGVLAYRNVIGGGDAKMIAASLLLVSPERAVELLLAIAIAGGVLSVICLVFAAALRRRAARDLNANAPADRTPPKFEKAGAIELPYGLAILAGVVFLMARRT